MLFPFCCVASLLKPGKIHRMHNSGMVEAINIDEALGKAHRIGLKVFPTNLGWYDHYVSLGESVISNPDDDISPCKLP